MAVSQRPGFDATRFRSTFIKPKHGYFCRRLRYKGRMESLPSRLVSVVSVVQSPAETQSSIDSLVNNAIDLIKVSLVRSRIDSLSVDSRASY